MCLYSTLGKNKKYRTTVKNGGVIPLLKDERIKYVPYACGECMECRKKKARDWLVRLIEDIKTNIHGKFIALTFSDTSIAKLTDDVNNYILHKGKRIKHKRNLQGYILDNEIATRAMRLFNERWRKKTGKALRHWMITELGHKGTENIHLHGIIWVEGDKETVYETLEQVWMYGHIWPRKGKERKNTYVNDSTIAYMTKYVSKRDEKHKTYKGKILTSAGIGANYINTYNSTQNKFKDNKTIEAYRTSSGHKIALPTYWRNKIYTEEEREKLWIEKLNKEERWVGGEKVDISKGQEEYEELREHYRKINKQLGYGDGIRNINEEEYERDRRIIMQQTRIAKGKKKEPPAG